MCKFVRLKEGSELYSLDGVRFTICSFASEVNTTQDYISGNVSNCDAIKEFQLPAIKTESVPNDDGYYKLYKLICHVENGKMVIDRVLDLMDNGKGIFFDDTNCRMLVLSPLAMAGQEGVEIGKVTGQYHQKIYMWKYTVTSDDQC